MDEARKSLRAYYGESPSPSEPSREIRIPPGWKYKPLKLGFIDIPWYASPESQLLLVSFVCFLCPGMFNAINGLGGGGGLARYSDASTAANTAVYATFAIVGFFAGTIVNAVGIRTALSFGGLGYSIYIGALLSWHLKPEPAQSEANVVDRPRFAYAVFAGVLLGCCAGVLWCAQGAIMMAYPTEKMKGRFISRFWIIFNLGAVIGSLVSLGANFSNDSVWVGTGSHVKTDEAGGVNTGTYIAILILTLLGAFVSWTLVDAKQVVRGDGSRIILMKQPTWKTEIIGLWETFRNEPFIVLLFPMFFASNWFYTYQFNGANLAQFNVRTRALNNTLYWLAQMFGAYVFGAALDFPNFRRTTRAKIAWGVMFVLTLVVWGGGYAFQATYHRRDPDHEEWQVKDWNSTGYVGPMFLYIFYGFYDAAWQTCVYWFMGAITNNSRKLANYAGFYKGIQSAGAAVVWRLDNNKVSFLSLFISCWVLLAGSLIVALPVMILKIKDTVPIEEDLKFTDETIDDVFGLEPLYTTVRSGKV